MRIFECEEKLTLEVDLPGRYHTIICYALNSGPELTNFQKLDQRACQPMWTILFDETLAILSHQISCMPYTCC